MLYSIDGLGGSDAVGDVGISITVKGFELATLFPCQVMAQIFDGVARYQKLVYPLLRFYSHNHH